QKKSKIMYVLKADGYGHGAVPIAKAVESLEYIWGFGVATVEEGISLRKHGITKPIHILDYTFYEDYENIVKWNLQPTVFTYQMAENFSKAARKVHLPVKIQIAVDTGMSRIGFLDKEESIDIIQKITKMPELQLEGIFTHFATADEKDKKRTTIQQHCFTNFIKKLEERGIHIPLKHCSNSAAALDVPEAHMDLVRGGIITYGIYPSDEVDRLSISLKPALSLKSQVVFVKDLEAGVEISYGGTYVTKSPTKVATIPVGYGDGYPRSLSSKGWVLIHGQKAPILGRVCMDQFMVDVTHIEDVKINDSVTLAGQDGEEILSIETLGELSGRFHYEFVCDLSKRIPRCYLRNGEVVECKDYFGE
ncbi:MAG TPA: alanine racemase, partial [Candidatus Merdenecus merdavium]|nr:alanine racemase [Candidatus Merdenecus merdavium]